MKIVKVVIVIWVVVNFLIYFKQGRLYFNYYKNSVFQSQEIRDRLNTSIDDASLDFYDVVKFCQAAVPENEYIRFVFPHHSTRMGAFLGAKGRYYLYPRNYGDNTRPTNFILVFLEPNFSAPQDFESCVNFGKDKGLWIKKDHPLKAKICHDTPS